ncbi:hypothetical protein M9472_003340 [Salmonella enterica]|nr:hypothetical protein [Salmonella enterica]EJG3989102.1 hypothetical protein [Salmonella enterica]
MERSEFYRCAECLQVSVNRMALKRWCDSPEHRRQLREICRGTVPFMLPPEEERDQAWRREAWAHLEREYPEALKQVLSLTESSLLRGWLQEYGDE